MEVRLVLRSGRLVYLQRVIFDLMAFLNSGPMMDAINAGKPPNTADPSTIPSFPLISLRATNLLVHALCMCVYVCAKVILPAYSSVLVFTRISHLQLTTSLIVCLWDAGCCSGALIRARRPDRHASPHVHAQRLNFPSSPLRPPHPLYAPSPLVSTSPSLLILLLCPPHTHTPSQLRKVSLALSSRTPAPASRTQSPQKLCCVAPLLLTAFRGR